MGGEGGRAANRGGDEVQRCHECSVSESVRLEHDFVGEDNARGCEAAQRRRRGVRTYIYLTVVRPGRGALVAGGSAPVTKLKSMYR